MRTGGGAIRAAKYRLDPKEKDHKNSIPMNPATHAPWTASNCPTQQARHGPRTHREKDRNQDKENADNVGWGFNHIGMQHSEGAVKTDLGGRGGDGNRRALEHLSIAGAQVWLPCVCVCVCVYVYICIHTHTHIHTHMYVYTRTHSRTGGGIGRTKAVDKGGTESFAAADWKYQ